MIPLVLKVNGTTKNLWNIMEPDGNYGNTEEEHIQYALKHFGIDVPNIDNCSLMVLLKCITAYTNVKNQTSMITFLQKILLT